MARVSDDFRVTVDLENEGPVADFVDEVRGLEVEGEVAERLGDRVVISNDRDKLFFYTDTDEAAREVETVVRPLLEKHGLGGASVAVLRWHPVLEDWLDASVPLPDDPAEIAEERRRYVERESAEARERGWTDFEVRAELPTHRSTVEFAKRLEDEGIPVVRRWKYLIVGAATEEEALALAERLRGEAPEGARFHVEGSGALAWKAGEGGSLSFLGGIGN